MKFQDTHLSHQFDVWLIGFYTLKCFLEVINSIIPLRYGVVWMKKARIAKSLGNVNSYKARTLHSIKYALAATILLGEVILFISTITGVVEYQKFEESANEYFHTIVSNNCSIYNSQMMVCAAYLGVFCLLNEALSVVMISTILGTLVILTKFLNTALTNSEIDTNSIKTSFHKMFWRNLITFTLISMQMTNVLGIVVAYSYIMYQILFQLRRAIVKLYHALVTKANDPRNNSIDRKYFQNRAQAYKRGSTLVFISVLPLLTSLSLFYILKKGIFELLDKPCCFNYLYSIEIPRDIIHSLRPAMNLTSNVISIAERLSLFSWIVVTIPLNLIIQVRYVIDYVKSKRLIGRHQYRFPGHRVQT